MLLCNEALLEVGQGQLMELVQLDGLEGGLQVVFAFLQVYFLSPEVSLKVSLIVV